MRKSLLTIPLFLFVFQLSAQYQIGHTSITFNDPARGNRAIETEIYYPAQTAGDNTPLADGAFPVIQFGHGFVMVWSAYEHFWQNLVPQGFILCFPRTEGSFSPSHTEFAKDLAYLCTAVQAAGADANSLFFNHIMPRFAVMGHSMGGGCSVLAYQYNPDLIKCVATFAPANTNPGAIAVAPSVSVPSLTFAGSYDCIAPPPQQAQLIYEALDTAACKRYVNISGGSHCQFGGGNTNCTLGEVFSGCSNPPITAAVQQEIVHNLLSPWLKTYLSEDTGSFPAFEALFAAQNGFSGIDGCKNAVSTSAVSGNSGADFTLIPNPAGDQIGLIFSGNNVPENALISIFDLGGRLVKQITNVRAGAQKPILVPVQLLAPGPYIMAVQDEFGRTSGKLFIKI